MVGRNNATCTGITCGCEKQTNKQEIPKTSLKNMEILPKKQNNSVVKILKGIRCEMKTDNEQNN